MNTLKYAVLGLLFAVGVTTCSKVEIRTPRRYVLPEGFSGWVLVEFGRAGAPPLPTKDGSFIFEINRDGRLVTSSAQEYGLSHDEYVGADGTILPRTGWGGGGIIWAASSGSVERPGASARFFEVFFVGPEAEYKNSHQVPPQPP